MREREAFNESNLDGYDGNEDNALERAFIQSERSNRSHPREMREHARVDNLSSIKVNIPSFQGRNDPEAYLDWE